MSNTKRLKRAIVCLWIVTFMPLCCSGCDYSSLGPILDCITVIASCCGPWGMLVAAVVQVVKIGASYYGRTRAEDELKEAYAENRQPKYDEATRIMTGIGGKDVGAPAGNANQQAGIQAASQVVAVGARTYNQLQTQPSTTGVNNNTAGQTSTQTVDYRPSGSVVTTSQSNVPSTQGNTTQTWTNGPANASGTTWVTENVVSGPSGSSGTKIEYTPAVF